MPFKCPKVRTRLRIPQADGVVPTPTRKQTAIRTEHYAIDRTSMPFKRLKVRTRLRIPQADGVPSRNSHSQAYYHPD